MSTQLPSSSDPDKDPLNIWKSLSGVFDARYFRELLSREVARAQRYKAPVSLVIGHIDNFKHIKETFGTTAGDKVLKAVGDYIYSSTRAADAVCRIGPDRLAIILAHTHRHGANRVCEHLTHRLYQLQLPAELQGVAVSLSFGIGEHESRESSDAFMMRVEQALDRATKNGDDSDDGLLGVPVRI